MDEKSLSHTSWNCKYHIVLVPKYRRKVIFFLQNYFLFGRWMRLVCLKYTQESGKKCQVVAKLENDLKM